MATTMTPMQIRDKRKELDRIQAQNARAVVKDMQSKLRANVRATQSLVDQLLSNATFQNADAAQRIKALVDLDNLCNKVSVELAFLIGGELRDLRMSNIAGVSDHGNWKPHLSDKIGINYRRACRYMSIYDTFKTLKTLRAFDFKTVEQALAAVAFLKTVRGRPIENVQQFWDHYRDNESGYNRDELLGIHTEKELKDAEKQRKQEAQEKLASMGLPDYRDLFTKTRATVSDLLTRIKKRFPTLQVTDITVANNVVNQIDWIIKTTTAIRDHLKETSDKALAESQAAPIVEADQPETTQRAYDMPGDDPAQS